MTSLAAGNTDVLVRLYDRHADALFGIARRILRNRQDAEDLLHDVFVEMWEKASQYDAGRGSLRSWLVLRMRSRAIDRLRSLTIARKRGMADPLPIDDTSAFGAHPPAWDRPDQVRARRAVQELPEEQRQVVELSYFEGFTHREMAAHCGIPLGTVKSRLSAAMIKLRQALAIGAESA